MSLCALDQYYVQGINIHVDIFSQPNGMHFSFQEQDVAEGIKFRLHVYMSALL